MDQFMNKGLSIVPVAMLEFIKFHRQLFYYPSPNVINAYIKHFSDKADYEAYGKKLIETTVGEHWLKKKNFYYDSLISLAFKNGDSASVLALYCDILDYSTTLLKTSTINYVLS